MNRELLPSREPCVRESFAAMGRDTPALKLNGQSMLWYTSEANIAKQRKTASEKVLKVLQVDVVLLLEQRPKLEFG